MATSGSPTRPSSIWRHNLSTGVFTSFELPTPNAFPGDITTGADGNMWFTEQAVGKFGRMGVNKDSGLIAAGKLADMVLIDGDPTKNIRDIHKIITVVKGGKVYDPAAIEKALGIPPHKSGP